MKRRAPAAGASKGRLGLRGAAAAGRWEAAAGAAAATTAGEAGAAGAFVAAASSAGVAAAVTAAKPRHSLGALRAGLGVRPLHILSLSLPPPNVVSALARRYAQRETGLGRR